MKHWVAGAVLAMTCAVAPLAEAATIRYTATLNGANEVPPNASTGTGKAIVEIFDGLTMGIHVEFSGLAAPMTAAHLHNAFAGSNGAVVTTLPVALGVTSGSGALSFDLADTSTWSNSFLASSGGTADGARAAFLTAIAAGSIYVNLHTQLFAGGELRGQLTVPAIPLPGTGVLAIAGLVSLAGAARRRRGD